MIEKSSKARKNKKPNEILLAIGGAALFAVSVNLFVVPIGLYSGGFVGLSQLIRTVLVRYFNMEFSFDVAGLINFGFNIPLLTFCFLKMGRGFFFKTLLAVIVQTVLFSAIPIPLTPILDDVLSNLIIAGVLGGLGCAMVLMARSCAGGTDILGVYTSMKGFSIGKLTIAFNAVIYILCAILFDFKVAIYSILYTVVFSMVIDKYYALNTEIMLLIITSNEDVVHMILNEYKRGVTVLEGKGAFTGENKKVLVSVISEFEQSEIQNRIKKIDPNAFVIASRSVAVKGNYEIRLV